MTGKNAMWTVPNILTMIRILMIPVFVIMFYVPAGHWDFAAWNVSFHWTEFIAALIFSLSRLTDLADGYIARKYNLCSKFGAFLDPVADKLTVTTALVLIVERFCNSGILGGHTWIITIPAITIIGREIAITALREWMAELGKRTVVAVSWIGKWKTTFQMVAIAGLIWNVSWGGIPVMVYLAMAFLYVAVVLTFWSMFRYFAAASKYFALK